jgi:outer membrane protein TolC
MVYSQQDTLIFKYRRLAVDYQQSVKMAEKGLEGTSSLVDASKAGFLPRIDVNGNYRFNGNPIQLGITDESPDGQELTNMYELGLWVSQPVLTGGYLKNTKNMAIARMEVARSYVDLSEQNTMLEADAQYLSVVTKKEISDLSIKYRDAIGQFQQVIQDRVDEEVVGMNELYQAKVRYNDAQYDVIRMEKEFRVSLMGLNRLIGVPLETQSQHMDSLLVVDWNQSVESRVEKALELRPEVSLFENEMAMNQYGEKVAASEQTKLELEKTMDIVTLQVTAGYYELERSQEQVDFAFSSLDNASKNVEVMLDRYYEGLSSVLEVLDAQLFWQKSYLNYIEAKFELNMAYSTYQKAMGELSVNQ